MVDKTQEYTDALRRVDIELCDDGHCPHLYEPHPTANQCYICGESRDHRHHTTIRATGTCDPHTGERIVRTFYEEEMP